TVSANKLVLEAILDNEIVSLQGYSKVRKEVPYGAQNSRIDILLEDPVNNQSKRCFVEVKNVSLGIGGGKGLFPDAVTVRGRKHMEELIHIASSRERAVLLFCVQHEGINQVFPADDIDPEYSRLLRQAAAAGVEILAYGTDFDIHTSTLRLNRELSVET
ncbi:MAG: DNA/RNA nuclease SfsA, partial [Pseudomonadota bacterium]|nr:DNA/RNA nuclease SfsA [Pseudomonadota bacterium]